MPFRDDREALRARLDAAESELADARRELDALRAAPSASEAPPARAAGAKESSPGGCLGPLLVTLALLGAAVGFTGVFRSCTRTHPGFEAATLVGTVTAVRGVEGVAVGERCTLRVSPVPRGTYNCRLRLQCGARLVYGAGASGYTRCAVDGAGPVRASDPRTTGEEGDPALTLDLPRGALHLWDDDPGPASLDVAFPPRPAKGAE